VILLARCMTKAPDFWDTKLDLTRAVKERLDREGISIPFPQRDVHWVGTPSPRIPELARAKKDAGLNPSPP